MKDSVLKVTNTINMWLSMSSGMLGGADMKKKLVVALDRFTARWSAD